MKFFLLIGGLSGFVLSLAASLHAGNAPSFALRDAGLGCCAAALLFRGLHFVVMSVIRSHVAALAGKVQAERAAAAKPAS